MECRICYETLSEDNIEILECAHSLCQKCLGNLRQQLCPFCRNPISKSPSTQTLRVNPLINNIPINTAVLHIIVAPPTRRRMRRRRRRNLSPMQPPRELSPSDIEVIGLEEDNKDYQTSRHDKERQRRRNTRNRWRVQRSHNAIDSGN